MMWCFVLPGIRDVGKPSLVLSSLIRGYATLGGLKIIFMVFATLDCLTSDRMDFWIIPQSINPLTLDGSWMLLVLPTPNRKPRPLLPNSVFSTFPANIDCLIHRSSLASRSWSGLPITSPNPLYPSCQWRKTRHHLFHFLRVPVFSPRSPCRANFLYSPCLRWRRSRLVQHRLEIHSRMQTQLCSLISSPSTTLHILLSSTRPLAI